MCDPAQEMGAEVRNPGAVLCCRSLQQAVVQDRLELIVFAPGDVGMAVKHDPGRLLANALAHHARLAVLDQDGEMREEGSP